MDPDFVYYTVRYIPYTYDIKHSITSVEIPVSGTLQYSTVHYPKFQIMKNCDNCSN